MSHSTLTRKDVLTIVDALRKSLLYQTPHPIFLDEKDDTPDHVVVKLKLAHYETVMRLIRKAGGWTLPLTERQRIVAEHEARARRAHGDGITYDFSELVVGELYAMFQETKALPELADFHKAIGEEISKRSADSDPHSEGVEH